MKLDANDFSNQPECKECRVRGLSPAFCLGFSGTEKVCRSLKISAGKTVFFAGDTPTGLYKIKAGFVKIEVISALKGSSHILRIKKPGEVLGYALFSGEPYRSNAVAVEECHLCFISRDQIFEHIAKKPDLAFRLLGQLAEELRLAEHKWIRQVDKEAHERVAEVILFLNEQFPNQRWTRREIGEWTGTTPETVMRTISDLKKQKLITTNGKTFSIIDKAQLSELAR